MNAETDETITSISKHAKPLNPTPSKEEIQQMREETRNAFPTKKGRGRRRRRQSSLKSRSTSNQSVSNQAANGCR